MRRPLNHPTPVLVSAPPPPHSPLDNSLVLPFGRILASIGDAAVVLGKMRSEGEEERGGGEEGEEGEGEDEGEGDEEGDGGEDGER